MNVNRYVMFKASLRHSCQKFVLNLSYNIILCGTPCSVLFVVQYLKIQLESNKLTFSDGLATKFWIS